MSNESGSTAKKGPLHKFGTAKIGGLSCNKKAATVLRIDLEIPPDQLQEVLAELQLEASDELRAALADISNGLL